MARVSAQTGIAPQMLADLDGDVWAALVDAVDRRWTQVEEMLTFQAELLHELIRVTLGIHGRRTLEPLRLPRPNDAPPASVAEQMEHIAATFGGEIRRG